MKKRTALLLILIVLTEQLFACKCAYDITVSEAFKHTNLIVYGKIIAKKKVSYSQTLKNDKVNGIRAKLDDENRKLFDSIEIFEVELEIIEKYKGTTKSNVLTVYTTSIHGSCGINFQLGKTYILYALEKGFLNSFFLTNSEKDIRIEKENTYWAHQCTRTTEYNEVEGKELKGLKTKSK